LSLKDLWLRENTHKKSKNCVFYEPCHATSAEEWMPHGIHVSMPRHRFKGGKLRRIRRRHMNCTRIGGHTWGANWLKNLHTPRMYPRAHMSARWRKKWMSRPHRGSAELWVQQNLPWVGWSWPSTWCLFIVSTLLSRGDFAASQWTSQPINRRRSSSLGSRIE
jgi:hypothetical protein